MRVPRGSACVWLWGHGRLLRQIVHEDVLIIFVGGASGLRRNRKSRSWPLARRAVEWSAASRTIENIKTIMRRMAEAEIPILELPDCLMRHQGQQKREASLRVMELMLPLEVQKFQHPSAPSGDETAPRRCRQISNNKWLEWWT